MTNELKASGAEEDIMRSFDINEVAFDENGVIDFYWPLDNKKSEDVMNSLTDALIPYITNNEKKFSELIAVRLLFKWFICETLDYLKQQCLLKNAKR